MIPRMKRRAKHRARAVRARERRILEAMRRFLASEQVAWLSSTLYPSTHGYPVLGGVHADDYIVFANGHSPSLPPKAP